MKINKKRLFSVNIVILYSAGHFLRHFMRAIVACMRVPFSKMVKNFSIFVCSYTFLPFLSNFQFYFSLILPLSEKNARLPSCPKNMQCSALLHSVLHNLVVCANIYKNVYSMLQARSQEFLRAGEVSVNQDTNSSQFRERKLNVNTKVSFFEKQLFLSYGDYFSKYPNPSYRFIIKRLPSGLNILTKKNKECYFIFLYYLFGLHFQEAIKQ